MKQTLTVMPLLPSSPGFLPVPSILHSLRLGSPPANIKKDAITWISPMHKNTSIITPEVIGEACAAMFPDHLSVEATVTCHT